jgi:polyisoprenoid-binding protein YceI
MPAFLLLLLALLAPGDAPRTFAVAPGSTLAYHLKHPFHGVDGVSRAAEGKARMLPDGTVQVMVRARVDSFDSGNSNRDAHMQEVTDAARHPYVVLKAVADGVHLDAYPAEVDVPLRGALDLHGVTRELAFVARVRFESAERAVVTATFPVSLTAYGVARPSLVFVPVGDELAITAHLTLALEPPG